jgi:hypothetical protein
MKISLIAMCLALAFSGSPEAMAGEHGGGSYHATNGSHRNGSYQGVHAHGDGERHRDHHGEGRGVWCPELGYYTPFCDY